MKYRTNRVGKPNVMPPWYIEKDIGIQQYEGDISLSEMEIAKIAAWADTGAPRGDPADLPAPVAVYDASGWEIGEPDLVLTSPEVEVASMTPDWWGPMGETPTGLTEDRYVSAIEMREVSSFEGVPERDTIGGLYVIHHLVMTAVGPDGKPPAEAGFWPVHEVGRNADIFHPDAGKLLQAGSKILFPSAHLHSNGRHTRAHLEIGLKFHPPGYQPTGTVRIIGPARSSRQSCNPAGGSPAVSIVRVGHEAMPHPGAGNQPGDAWCKRPGRPARRCAAVGAAWRSSECGGLNGNGMATAPKSRYLVAAAVRGGLVRRAHSRGAKTGVSKEGTDKRTWRAPRGRGPSTHTRIAGNNVGKDHLPAGAGRNLRRPVV